MASVRYAKSSQGVNFSFMGKSGGIGCEVFKNSSMY